MKRNKFEIDHDLRSKLFNSSSIILASIFLVAGIAYTVTGLSYIFGSVLLSSFVCAIIGLYIYKKGGNINKMVWVPIGLFYLNDFLGWFYLAGHDGSAPMMFVVGTLLAVTLVQINHIKHLIIGAVLIALTMIIGEIVLPEFIVPYADSKAEKTDKLFILILGFSSITTIGIFFRKRIIEEAGIIGEQEKKLDKINAELTIEKDKLAKNAWQLTESNERLEEFAYIASHDLKTPIRGAKNLIEFTLEDFESKLPKEAVSNLKKAKDSMVKMNALVVDLLAYSKADKIELSFKNSDLNELINEISDSIEKDEKSIISFSELPTVHIDPSRIREVFYNFITNGLKYNQSESKLIEIGFTKETNSLWIKDNGIGIDKENHDKIFKFFQRLHTDKEYEGTGTGLALVKRILERHQIEISIESSLGNGTTFYLDLKNCIVD